MKEKNEMTADEIAQNATALQLAKEWQEVITILAADTAECLELDMEIGLKEKRGHPFWWGKVSVLRTLKAMADADVERFASGATLLAELEAAQADNIRLREALRLAVEEIGTDMHYVPAAIEEQILAALRS